MPWPDGLSDEQRRAASHAGRPARLIAGPGTGKTLALTRRAEYLVTERTVATDAILLLTFTRAAAAELRQRLHAALGQEAAIPRVSTLHSFALRQLLRNPAQTRLPTPIRIADDYEERWIVEEELATILGLGVVEVRQLFRHLANDWERLAVEAPGWEGAFAGRNPRFLGAWREHRAVYGYTLRSELVYQLKAALDQTDIPIEVPAHLLVDEFQDLNACDLALVRAMARRDAELFAAGDDDQSIYGFRFAAPEGIRAFTEQYPGSESLALEECRRCGSNILNAALFVAEQDPRRLPKVLRCPDGAPPGDVRLLRFADQMEEAEGVATICQWLIRRQELTPRSVLVLLRSDRNGTFSTPIRERLTAHGVPVAVENEPLAPLDKGRPGRQLLCVLRLVNNRLDSLAWNTLLQERINGIGGETIRRIYEFAREQGRTFAQVLPDAAPALGRRGGMLREELAAITPMLDVAGAPEAGQLQPWLIGLAQRIVPDEPERLHILQALGRLREGEDSQTLEQLLRTLGASLGESEQEAAREDAVALMTMHQAKGLTAEAVIVVACEAEYIPGRAVGGAELDDARRLLYVSMTRARRFLFMTYCQQRVGAQRHTGSGGGTTRRQLTPFLEGLPRVPIRPWPQAARDFHL